MVQPVVRVAPPPAEELLAAFRAVRREFEVPESFPADVDAAAREAAARAGSADRVDLRDVPFVTLDPPGSLDLDQAMAISRRDRGGWQLRYAIADVAAWVTPDGPVDREARRRGVTLYSPDLRTPLHPPVLCEQAASLLPGGDRPALVWRLDLDDTGALVGEPVVERAVVRSRAQLSYPAVQDALDAGRADEVIVLLEQVGRARLAQEQTRGGVSLDLPDQQVLFQDGRYVLSYRRPLPVEGWNAQLSLLTGMAAAHLMVAGGLGLLRTLPRPDPRTVDAIRRSARALGLPVAATASYAEVVRAADPATDAGAALLHQAARALRGAGYVVLGPDTAASGAQLEHSAIASTYAHVTAPLRRLADRFANEIALALSAGTPVPAWATDALPALPQIMADAHEREGRLTRAMIDTVEALMLRDRVGQSFDGSVTNIDHKGGVVQLRDPAVLAHVAGVTEPLLGHDVTVRLDAVEVPTRAVTFTLASP